MRLGLFSTLLLLALATAPSADAQVDGCSDQAIALALDGTPMDLDALRRQAEGVPGGPHALDWCGGDDDVRCQSIPPAPDAPSYESPAQAPRFLDVGFTYQFAAFQGLEAPSGVGPQGVLDGPSGVTSSLDRPPRVR